jgi:hypothetical protein
MNKLVFAIYDSKAEYFKNPIMMRTKGEALRGFIDVANDKQTDIGMHPEDFTLFCIAEYDEIHGVYINKVAPESMGVAIEFVNNEKKDLQMVK